MLNLVKTSVNTIECFTNIRPPMPTSAVCLSTMERSIGTIGCALRDVTMAALCSEDGDTVCILFFVTWFLLYCRYYFSPHLYNTASTNKLLFQLHLTVLSTTKTHDRHFPDKKIISSAYRHFKNHPPTPQKHVRLWLLTFANGGGAQLVPLEIIGKLAQTLPTFAQVERTPAFKMTVE